MKFSTRIQKGDHYFVEIPRQMVKSLDLTRGDVIDMETENGHITLRPRSQFQYELGLLSREEMEELLFESYIRDVSAASILNKCKLADRQIEEIGAKHLQIRYVAMDANGNVFGFIEKPNIHTNVDTKWRSGGFTLQIDGMDNYSSNWKLSLTKIR